MREIENKVSDHNHYKYTTTSEFNNLAAGAFDERSARANVVTKPDFDTKLQDIKQSICLLKLNKKN